MSDHLRTISCGCGHQSTALVVLATQGRLGRVDAVLWANVGDDSEHPDTIKYAREVLAPFCAENGLPFHELQRRTRSGSVETLRGRLMKEGSRSIPIPVRAPRTGAPGTRSCTVDFKIDVLRRWLRENGATPENPAEVMIGFSTDEVHRVGRRRDDPIERPIYPLLDPAINLDRAGCGQVIVAAGLPLPPKSACYFCLFHRPAVWAEMRRDRPDLFADAALIESTLNARRATLQCGASGEPAVYTVVESVNWNDEGTEVEKRHPVGKETMCPRCEETVVTVPGDDGAVWPEHTKGPLYLTGFGKPLVDAVAEAQPSLSDQPFDGFGTCDEGACFT